MKRSLILILAFVLVFSSIAQAAPGDIIHTGLKKIYKAGTDSQDLIKDIVNGADPSKFYRELEDGKYINIQEEEEAQVEALRNILESQNLSDPEEIRRFLEDESNLVLISDEINKEINKIIINDFQSISDPNKGDLEDYTSPSELPRLKSPENYSMPEYGSKPNTTMIRSLTYPAGSSKWFYKILDEADTKLKLNNLIDGSVYKAGEDIEVEAGKYIGLYATDRSNRLKAYTNIKVEESMIRRAATLVEGGTLDKGKDLALSVAIYGIEGNWKYIIRTEDLAHIFKDTKFTNPLDFVAGQDIVVANDNTIIDENFRRFIYIFNTDEDGNIDKYYKFEINRDHISKLPERLEESVHYAGPIIGDVDGTTKFTKLDTSYEYKYIVDESEMPIPALDADFSSKATSITQDEGIEANSEDYLLLLALDSAKRVRAFAQFKLTEDQVKGITPPVFTINPEKGYGPSTTRVKNLELSNENHKWMYVLGTSLSDPVLNKTYEGAKDYSLGQDIVAEVGQSLMILETDSVGRVKRFAKANLDIDNVKSGLAYNLGVDKGAYLKDPIKGSTTGSIKFDFLRYEDCDFILVTSDDLIPIPEMDQDRPSDFINIEKLENGYETKDIKVYEDNDEKLKADEGFKDFAMVLAVDKNNKIKAYYSFELNRENVKLPEAGKLNSGGLVNYELTRGDGPNTTKITKLDPTGLSNVNTFRYRVIDEEIEIEYNTIISATSLLRENANIPGSIGKYLLILAVDSANRTKYYDIVALDEDNLRYANAPILRLNTNFLEPLPGDEFNSTKVTFLSLPEGASKWIYMVLDSSYGPVELNRTIEDEGLISVHGENKTVEIIDVKANQWLLLLAVDDNGLAKAYYNKRLNENHIKGGKAPELKEGLNYKIDKGAKAGTTRFTDLEGLGLENATSTRWKYKLVGPGEEQPIPALGSIVEGIPSFYNVNTDILVSKDSEGNYGYILLLATDLTGRTKAYKYIPLNSDKVKEHANYLDGISLVPGQEIDTTKVEGLNLGENNYCYVLSDDMFDDYAAGDFLPPGYISYSGGDIKVRLNQYLTIFELDNNGNINRFRVFEIKDGDVNLGQAKLTIVSEDNSLPETNTLLEGSIRLGGKTLRIALENGSWLPDIERDGNLRDKLYRGLIANNDSTEWTKVINAQLDDRFNITQNGKILEIDLVSVPSFDITVEERISMVIDPSLVEGGVNPIYATGEVTIKPTITANISGDVVDRIIRAEDIKNGGVELKINLVDGYWKPTKDINLSLLWAGFKGGPKWTSLVGKEGFKENSTVIRSSSRTLTITLPKVEDLDWGYEKEEIFLEIRKGLLVDAVEDVIATPSFTIYPDELKVEASPMVDEVWLVAPDGREVRQDHNKWRIKVTNGRLKEDVTTEDLSITGLAKGLVVTASKAEDEDNVLDLLVSGRSNTSISKTKVYVTIKGSAVIEPDSLASSPIELVLKTAEPMDFSGIQYGIEDNSLIFTGITDEMEYSTSLDSTWKVGDGKEVSFPLEPIKVIVRERVQAKITTEFIFENGDSPEGITIESYEYLETGKVEVQLKGIDKEKMEYSIDSGSSYEDFEDEEIIKITLGQNDDLRVRFKAVKGKGDEGKLPSKPTPKLNGIYLGNVDLAAGEGKIKNTTANMEYSLGSTTGTDGIWVAAKNKETNVEFSVGNEVWIRDKADIKNFRYLGTIVQAEKPTLTYVDYNIALGKVYNGSGQDLEFRIAGGPWQTIWRKTSSYGIEFKPGELEFRVKAHEDVLASLPVKKATIPAQNSPVVVDIDDVENIILSINGIDEADDWDVFEYRVNPKADTPWNNGINLKNEDLSGDKNVEIRLKATKYTLPSLTTLVKFTKNLDMSHVVLSDYTNPPVLNGTTNIMEYQIVTVESTSPWTRASNGNTTLPGWVKDFLDKGLLISIKIRDSRQGQQDNVYTVVEPTPSDDVRLNNIEYKFENKEIIFSNITGAMEYSSDNINWTVGTGADITFVDEPLSLYVRLRDLPYVYREFKINRPEAPSEVILEVVDYPDEDTAKVKIINFENTMEYSLDGGNEWENLTGETITINANSHLIVRYKFVDGDSEGGSLSSRPTNRLNTIFLGKVSIDAGNGLLINTNNSMEYSTDSTNGTDGRWEPATDPQTPISFNLGDTVWVRERGNPDHYRKVATIGQEPEPSLGGVTYHIFDKLISNTTDQNLEYRIDGGDWITIYANTDDLNVEFKPGALEFRKQANGSNLPSEPKLMINIPGPDSPPTVRAIDEASKRIEYFDSTTRTWTNITNDFEYKLGVNGDWIPGNEFTDDSLPNSNIVVYVRKVATDTRLASEEASISFTENLDFSNLRLNVAKGVIENTTNEMEYSLDSTDGLDGRWFRASPNSTGIDFVEGMNIWFREIGKPTVNSLIVSNLQRRDIEAIKEDLINTFVSYDVGKGKFTNSSNEHLQYRIGGGNWHTLAPYSEIYDVVFREGIVEIRMSPNDVTLPSLPIELGVVKAPASMPVVVYDDVENIIISIDGETDWTAYEYRITGNGNTTPWLPGEILGNEDLSGRKTVEIRKKADKWNLPSQIRPIDFTPNLQLDHVRLSTHVSPLELNGTTRQMEYLIYLTNGSNVWVYGNWTVCEPDSNGNTKLPEWLMLEHIYKIEVRDKEQAENFYEIFP